MIDMEQLVPIGRFSKMTRLSIEALRLYDEIPIEELQDGLPPYFRPDPDSPEMANMFKGIIVKLRLFLAY